VTLPGQAASGGADVQAPEARRWTLEICPRCGSVVHDATEKPEWRGASLCGCQPQGVPCERVVMVEESGTVSLSVAEELAAALGVMAAFSPDLSRLEVKGLQDYARQALAAFRGAVGEGRDG
jgi:hypothetical protein